MAFAFALSASFSPFAACAALESAWFVGLGFAIWVGGFREKGIEFWV